MVIGARGFIGEHLAGRAAGSHNVIRGDLEAAADDDVKIDITSAASVCEAFDRVRPDVVALLAALSDIDRCEREPAAAEAVNVHGAELVAQECARTGARLIYTSSAAVFDGARHGYKEDDPVSPLSVYGRTKAGAEKAIAAALPSAIIVRLALVLGYGLRRGTNSMLDTLAASLQAGRKVAVPTYERRNPIDAGTLCEFILDLAARPEARGIFHLGATDSMSRYSLVARLAEKMGYSPGLVTPQHEPMPGRAPRGLDHFLISDRIRRLCRRPIPNCEQVIERSLHGTA